MMRKEVLSLYGACLRSARKCPEWEQREMMKAYVRMKFRHEQNTRDPGRVRTLVADAKEELEQMEYYHSIYELKKQQAAAARVAPLPGQATAKTEPAACAACGTTYQPPHAKFCSNCGEKRA